MKVCYSEYGYVYYSWTELEMPSGDCRTYLIKNLLPNTNYVIQCLPVEDGKSSEKDASLGQVFTRTFTEEEELKRHGTVFEHALRLEKQTTLAMQTQIQNLTRLVSTSDENENGSGLSRSRRVMEDKQEELFSIRKRQDDEISTLRDELYRQSSALERLTEQKLVHESVIEDLMGESAKNQAKMSSEMLAQNERLVREYQGKALSEQEAIAQYQSELAVKKNELEMKERQVEKIMQDCRLAVQEHNDANVAKMMQFELALNEAKESLEHQVTTNTLLSEELKNLARQHQHVVQELEALKKKQASSSGRASSFLEDMF